MAALAGLVSVLAPAAASAADLEQARERHAAGDVEGALAAWLEVAADPASAPVDVATARNNACVVLSDRGELDQALEQCQAALGLRRELADPRLARTLNNLALVHQRRGELDLAARHYREALARNEALGDAGSAVVNLLNLGVVQEQAARYRAALASIDDALARARQAAGEPWTAEQIAVATINRGSVLERLGAHREALELYRELLGASLDRPLRATLLTNTGVMERNLGDPGRALRSFEEAAAIFAGEGDRSGLASAQLNRALVLDLGLARPDQAATAYAAAVEAAREAGNPADTASALVWAGDFWRRRGDLGRAAEAAGEALELAREIPEVRWSALSLLGRLARQTGESELAMERWSEAIAVIETVRSELGERRWKSGFLADKLGVYRAAVELAVERGELERGFAIVQRAKARELAEAVGQLQGAAALPGLHEIAAHLEAGEVVLELLQVESQLLRFELRKGRALSVTRLEGAGSYAVAAREARELVAGGETAERQLAELAGLLEGVDLEGVSTLFVAGDGALREIPLDLLPSDSGTLGERVELRLLPSATTLVGRAQQRPRPALALLAVAEPKPAAGITLPPLAASRREVEQALRALGQPSRVLTGEQATPQALREALRGGVRVLHVAAHTLLEARPEAGASIVLSPGEPGGDGLLGAADLATLEGSSELTVLAACSTARNDEGAGGFASLTGALLGAGSQAVLGTLWDVDDDATAVLMEQLYWELGRGTAPGLALARAKQRLRRDPRWSEPRLWAGFVLVGAGDSPVAKRSTPGWALALVGALGVALTLVVVRAFRPGAPTTR